MCTDAVHCCHMNIVKIINRSCFFFPITPIKPSLNIPYPMTTYNKCVCFWLRGRLTSNYKFLSAS